MADPVNLALIEGQPYSQLFRVVSGSTLWPQRQVWAHVRLQPGATLLADLTPYLTVDVDPAVGAQATTDLLITLTLTGADTRRLSHAVGFWDLFISEPGPAQTTGRRLLHGAVTIERAITASPSA